METHKSLACPALSHFLARLTLPQIAAGICSRQDVESFPLFCSPFRAGLSAQGQLLPQTCSGP